MILSAEIKAVMLSGYITCTHTIYLRTCFHLEISLLTKIRLLFCFITERGSEYKIYFAMWAKTQKKTITTITSRSAFVNI